MALLEWGVGEVIDDLKEGRLSGMLPHITIRGTRFHTHDCGNDPDARNLPDFSGWHVDSVNARPAFIASEGDRPIVYFSNGSNMKRGLREHRRRGENVLVQDVCSIGTGYRPLVS